LLNNKYELIHLSLGGFTISEILDQSGYYKMFYPDVVIIHVGIVDCAPRVLSKLQREIFSRFYLGRIIIKIIKKNPTIFRRIIKKVYTTPIKFEMQIKRLFSIFTNNPIFIAIGIIIPNDQKYKIQLPGIHENVQYYNKLLKKYFKSRFISVNDIPKECVMADCVHLTDKGHEYIFKKISNAISDIL
jgi:hypothetical protein|tara:strand:- start:2969 stop:3529 length:561 start_codon:yes stop_codon:yes gene_type:complete